MSMLVSACKLPLGFEGDRKEVEKESKITNNEAVGIDTHILFLFHLNSEEDPTRSSSGQTGLLVFRRAG